MRPQWHDSLPRQSTCPSNHGSAAFAMPLLLRHLRKGQDAGQYLILESSLASVLGVFASPFGAVAKEGSSLTVDARLIHDLSFPAGASVNDNRVPLDIAVAYDGPATIANAFRNIPIHADHVHLIAGSVPELGIVVIDQCCPFGWTNSPAAYWVAGGLIKHRHGHGTPLGEAAPFHSSAWCNCVEPDVATRLDEAELSLRSFMTAVLGPAACNELKFTTWHCTGKSLVLIWDLDALTGSMPQTKLHKALSRLSAMRGRPSTTRTELHPLLGSLRHVTTCVPAALPFLQRLASKSRGQWRVRRIALDAAAHDDLTWFDFMLHHAQFNTINLEQLLGVQDVATKIFMDASDVGLCVVNAAAKEFVQVRYTAHECADIASASTGVSTALTINVRELMSVAFAAVAWGPRWSALPHQRPTHICCRIDNTAAVAWNNRRTSHAPRAQVLEVKHNVLFSATHVAGVDNVLADAGSRVWASESHHKLLSNLVCGWRQVHLPPCSRDLSTVWRRLSVHTRSQRLYARPTDGRRNTIRISEFADFLWWRGMNKQARGNTHSTIASKICAIRWFHRFELGYEPPLDAGYALLMRGIRRSSAPVRKRQLLTPRMLRIIYGRFCLILPRACLLWGGLAPAYFFLLRRSEYLFDGRHTSQFILKLEDIHFFDASGERCRMKKATVVGVRLRGAKIYQFGRLEWRFQHASGDRVLCPVAAARMIVEAAKMYGTMGHEPALRTRSTEGISASEVNTLINVAARAVEDDPE